LSRKTFKTEMWKERYQGSGNLSDSGKSRALVTDFIIIFFLITCFGNRFHYYFFPKKLTPVSFLFTVFFASSHGELSSTVHEQNVIRSSRVSVLSNTFL